jgi:hypothetical protein
MLKWIFKISCVVFIFGNLKAQVINIENKRFLNDTNGWVGVADFTFNILQNTQQVISFSNSFRVQYQKNRSRIIFLNDLNFIKAGPTNFVNSGYQHIRYNFKVSKHLTFEAFTQTQYNPILRLNFRYLAGLGPRLKIVKTERARIYMAVLYMYEYDDITNEIQKLYEHRLSSYITLSFNLFKNADITSTTFYQPNLENMNDYRIANDTGIEIFISKHLNYKTSFNLLYDTKQPDGIPNLVYSLKNGISIKF